MTVLFTVALIGYLVGAVPSAALVAHLKGRRIFEVGSGNMGAMNTARNLGYAWGALVLLLDVGKGVLAALLGGWLASRWGVAGLVLVLGPLVAGLAAVCGHAWSVYVGFRGGKALAVALGVSLVLFPAAGLLTLGLLLVFLAVFRNATVASVLAASLLAAVLFLTTLGDAGVPRTAELWTAALMAVVILVKHWPDLQRLRERQEG